MTFKTTERILVSLQSPPTQDYSGYWIKAHQICTVVTFHRRCKLYNLCCDPSTRCQMRGATLKKKVASAKHKPAGGIVMPGGLINMIIYLFIYLFIYYYV